MNSECRCSLRILARYKLDYKLTTLGTFSNNISLKDFVICLDFVLYI